MNLLTLARRMNSNLALHPAMHLVQLIPVSLSTTKMYVVYERKLQIFAWRYQNQNMILSFLPRLGLLSPYLLRSSLTIIIISTGAIGIFPTVPSHAVGVF